MPRIVISVTLLLAVLFVHPGCSKGKSVVDPPASQASLKVYLGPGAIGTPATGTNTYSVGTVVTYQFHTQAGYSELVVLLDGQPVDSSGVVTATGDHTLVAMATTVEPIASAIAPLVADANALLTHPNPVAGYTSLLTQCNQLYTQYGPVVADSLIEDLTRAAYPYGTDATALQQLTEVLGNKTYGINDDGTVVELATPSVGAITRSRAISANRKPVALVYINGVMCDPFDASTGLLDVQSAVKQAKNGWRLNTDYILRFYYNRTYAYSDGWLDGCVASIARTYIRHPARAITALLDCAPAYFPAAGKVNDWFEAFRQLAELLMEVPSSSSPDVTNLANIITTLRANGHPVILVAHSQGNLMCQQALQVVYASHPEWRNCIAAISLAGPTSGDWPQTKYLSGLGVKGQYVSDFILWSPLNGFQTTPNNLSWVYDDNWKSYKDAGQDLLARVEWGLAGYRLHSSHESYFASGASRSLIVQTLAQAINALSGTVSEITVTPASLELPKGETAQLSAEAEDSCGNPVPTATFEWISSNTSVATVDRSGNTVTVRAVGSGSTDVVSGSGPVTKVIPVTVIGGPRVASIRITPPSAELRVGASASFSAEALDSDGQTIPNVQLTWHSGNTGIATVSPTTGSSTTATGIAEGSAHIQASDDAGHSGSAQVTVTTDSLIINPSSITSPSLGSGVPSTWPSIRLVATGGTPPYRWSLSPPCVGFFAETKDLGERSCDESCESSLFHPGRTILSGQVTVRDAVGNSASMPVDVTTVDLQAPPGVTVSGVSASPGGGNDGMWRVYVPIGQHNLTVQNVTQEYISNASVCFWNCSPGNPSIFFHGQYGPYFCDYFSLKPGQSITFDFERVE